MMMWRLIVPALAVSALACGAPAAMAQSMDAVYQQGLARERGAGDLAGAIELYQRVAQSGDRVLAAKALVRLGEAYEKMGAKEAQAAYERILRDYADQAEPVSVARQRLATMRSAPAVAARPAAAMAMVYADLPQLRMRDNPQYDFSPAGDQIVIRSPAARDPLLGAALEIVTSGGTVVRTLLPAVREMGRSTPRWSPDGKHIAFIQRSFLGADSSFAALMIVPAAGGTPRVVTREIPLPNPARGGVFWTPDSRGITIASGRGLVTVDLEGKIVRTAPMELRFLQHVTGYSPDGRWIAFHRTNDDTEQHDETDIWIIPATGGNRVQLTSSPGLDSWPIFADDRTIYFVSDRNGSANIFRLEIDPASGAPRGEPTQVTSYTDAMVMHPRLIDGGKRLAYTLVREMSAVRVGTPDGATRAIARGVSPQLSPDGTTIFYFSQGEAEPGIFAVPAAGGAPRRITSTTRAGNFFQPFSVSRDGSSLAFVAHEGRQSVLFTVPTRGGKPVELLRLDTREFIVPAWSPDGKKIAYAHGDGLYLTSASGGRSERIATAKKFEGWTVRWSPDGRHIAAAAWPAEGAPDENVIYVVPASGGEMRRVTPASEGGYKEGLEWHPDSERLTYMFYGNDWRLDEIRVAYADGRPTTRLLDQPYPIWDYVGTWHPNGRNFYHIASSRGEWGLFVHDATTGATRELFPESEGSAGVPAFSHDGSTMVFPVLKTTRQIWTVTTGR
jgi:Tol biopolymer transport system component